MRLSFVEISNYRVIRHARLALPDQLIGIIGPNGSGKSTIVEAISWALYGHQVARSGKEEIKASFARPAEDCQVELGFELKGEQYRLLRRLVGKTERSEVELFRGDATESIGIAETRGYIESLLGLDWRGFLTSFLARQQELNALTDLAPAKRREHLAGMLGIERIDRAINKARERGKLQADRLLLLADQVSLRETVQARLKDLREQLTTLDTAVAEATGADQSATIKLHDSTLLLREQQVRESTCSRYEAELGALAKSTTLYAESRAKITADLTAISRDLEALPKLESEVAGLATLRTELEQLRRDQKTESIRQQTKRQIESLQNDLAQFADQVANLTHQSEQLDQKIGAIAPDLLAQIEQLKISLAGYRDREVQLTTQRESLNLTVRKLTKQADGLTELGPESRCDRCLRPLSAHDLEQVREHLAEEQAGLRTELEQISRELTELGERSRSVQTELAELERLAKTHADLVSQRTKLQADQTNLAEKRTGADEQIRFMTAQLEQLGGASFDQTRFDTLTGELTSLEQAETRLHQMRGRLARQPQVEADLAETDRKLAEIGAESEKIKAAIAKIGFDRAMLDQAQAVWSQAQQAAETAKAELIRATHARDLAHQEMTLKEKQLEEYARAAAEIESSRAQQFRSEMLVRLFGDFRKELIARIRPRLAELTGQLLADMTDGRYSLVDLDEEYRIRLNDLGQYYGIERFSGGESDLANLCLRLAISQALTESAGMERSFVMLDEVFGSQDEARRDLVVQGLISLRGHFPQMILITHFEELKQKVEMLVELVPTKYGWSEVRVNGALA
jgi:exonuclease SbcC